MKRREFILLTAAAGLAPALAQAAVDYKPGLVEKHLAAGDTVFLDFKTDWCTTCRAQERVINALRSKNPAYNENIVFINVDYDEYGGSDFTRGLRIPRRSTLVVLKGEEELGRIVAETSSKTIQALMDTALEAATASS
jgi:thiol-disulfide isomerase/thioredoxin